MLGDLFRDLRAPVERLAWAGDLQVEYLAHHHVDGDELWNELVDELLTALVNLRPYRVLSAGTLDALACLYAGAEGLFDKGLWTDDAIRTRLEWADVRVVAAAALRGMDVDAEDGEAAWLTRRWIAPR